MARYAVGDVQGCHETLRRLVDRLGFDPATDRLWLVGDLVNRGPRSLEVLRWVRGLGEGAVSVLGNHDLHLLGRAYGSRPAKPKDTLDALLAAPDREELLDWLRRRPLVHVEDGFALLHAGLHPAWGWDLAAQLAGEVEAALRGPDPASLFEELAAMQPPAWHASLDRADRRRVAVEMLTRLRTCRADGTACRRFSGPPALAPPGCRPWFEIETPRDAERTVVCGHWAALGYVRRPGLIALDTGCVWGRELTAVRLDDGVVSRQPYAD